MIARLDLTAINDLREALPLFDSPPARSFASFNSDQRRAYWLDEISQSLADETSIAFRVGRPPGASADSSFTMIRRGTADIIGRTYGNREHLAVTR